MDITDIRWTRYRVPFKRPLVTAHGVFLYREGAIIEMTDERTGVIGIGEIAPPPGFGVSLDEALEPLPHIAAMARHGPALTNIEEWRSLPAATRFGLGTALIDSHKHPHRSQRQYGYRLVPVNATVTACSAEEAAHEAQVAASRGFACIKLKVGSCETVDAEIKRVAGVRAAIGPDTGFRIDANEAWDFDRALAVLSGVTRYDIEYCEQPVSRDNLDGMRTLRAEQPIPIAADEAVTDAASAQRILDAEAADILVVKPQLLGSEGECYSLIRPLRKGIKWVLTTSLEAGIGVVASARICAVYRRSRACGLATLDLLEDDLIIEPPRIENGHMAVPYGPGLGVELDRAALEKYAI